jgi:uncharacterized protein YndB with AHSA1/START domain
MSTIRINRHVKAPRARVYSLLVDADAISKWKVPDGMTSHVHAFDGREGGTFRISLHYEALTGVGKTTAYTDTYHGISRSSCRTSGSSKWSSSKQQIRRCAAR